MAKSKNKETSASDSFSNLPPEVRSYLLAEATNRQQLGAAAKAASETPYQPYTGARTADMTWSEAHGIDMLGKAHDRFDDTQAFAIAKATSASDDWDQYLKRGMAMTEQAGTDWAPAIRQSMAMTDQADDEWNATQERGRELAGLDAMLVNNQGMISQLSNPFTQQVIDTTLADMRRENELARIGGQARAAGAGAFGGSRHGVADALREGEFSRAVGSTASGLRKEGYDRAVTAAQADLDRRLQQGFGLGAMADTGIRTNLAQAGLYGEQANTGYGRALEAGRQYGDLGNAGYGRVLEQAGMLGDLASQGIASTVQLGAANSAAGQQQRAIDQNKLDVGYSDYLAARDYPKSQVSWWQSTMPGSYPQPSSFGTTSTSTSSNKSKEDKPSGWQTAAGLGIAALGAAGSWF